MNKVLKEFENHLISVLENNCVGDEVNYYLTEILMIEDEEEAEAVSEAVWRHVEKLQITFAK